MYFALLRMRQPTCAPSSGKGRLINGTMASVKRALVTGGGGYIGSRLCTALAEAGYTVTAFDRSYEHAECSAKIVRIQV